MSSDFVIRVKADYQGFELGTRVEIFQTTNTSPSRRLEHAPFGPYRVIQCDRVMVNGGPWLDVTLRKLRRSKMSDQQ